MEQRAFPNYTQINPLLPKWFWHVLRLLTLMLTLMVVYTLFAQPELGLVLFWKLMIPMLPLSFAVVPGLWRNICPMAFLNQLPRLFGLGLQRSLSPPLLRTALLVSIIGFIIFVTARIPWLNHSGTAVGVMLVSVLLLALIGGWVFKGRSGWCGTFCPLAPLQKVYGHAPLLLVRNGYCEPCVGCQKNCYDFNPRAAVFSDLDDADAWWSDNRKYFAALLPGLIIGFFNAAPVEAGLAETRLQAYYLGILAPPLITVGLYYTLQNTLRLGDYRQVALFGLAALAIFYWYGTPVVASGIAHVFGLELPSAMVMSIRVGVVLVCVAVMVRGLMSERAYNQAKEIASRASVGGGVAALRAAVNENGVNVFVSERASGKQFQLRPAQSLLDAVEAAELPIMSGCRMGMCGSDPVFIVEGGDQLDPPDENELATLRRLGLETMGLQGRARMACCCKPKGDITIDLEASPAEMAGDEFAAIENEAVEHEAVDDDRFHVIIVGNGIAGISTAESLRESDDNCRITLISQEPHHFYNRMGLEKVVHGRTAMQGLYLMHDDWYQRNHIDVWLNTRVLTVDSKQKRIELGTGEWLAYDRLVLATGGKAFVPPIPGADLPGCFTLRDANDAMAIRAWVQQHRCRQAIVLGGGVLGVEAADALRQLGLRVGIVHRAHQLMERQLDLQAGVILRQFLVNSGISVITGSVIERIEGDKRVQRVILGNGVAHAAELVLFCVGIRADTRLAEAAGLEINRGVVVDTQMRTSDKNIYSVGDAAELPGAIGGLWSVGSEQGKVAAASVLGRPAQYQAEAVPPVQLKLGGIDLKAFGSIDDRENVKSWSGGDLAQHRWKHLLARDGHAVGGVFVNSPLVANAAIAVARQVDSVLSDGEVEVLMSKDQG